MDFTCALCGRKSPTAGDQTRICDACFGTVSIPTPAELVRWLWRKLTRAL